MTSDSSLQLARSLVKFVKNICRAYVLIDGTIIKVNDNFTVDIKVQGTTISNVPTKVLIGSQASIYEIPVINTKCLVKWRDGNRGLPQIDSFDQVDKLLINCASLVEFNGGDNGGMVLVNNLVTKVNNLENLLNNLISLYNAHTHLLTLTSGTGTAAPTASHENGSISPITKASDLENTKITQ